jgi:hypothetical protein
VAVREIEAWLLADHEAVIELFGRKVARRLPPYPDEIDDPKAKTLSSRPSRHVGGPSAGGEPTFPHLIPVYEECPR